MCGLSGYLAPGASASPFETVLRDMSDALLHRGPDDGGIWFDAESGIGLSHRRLAIVDLSSAGAQPMVSPSGQFVIAYNGEIYNHLELRERLEREGVSHQWRGHSDTESLLVAIEAWGLDRALKECVGMFALALWCRQSRRLTLARDRMGEKPLYYGWVGKGPNASLVFGSELKALRRHPQFDAEIDRSALAIYMQYAYVPAPRSIFAGISKVLPGHMVTFDAENRSGRTDRYWSVVDAAEQGLKAPLDLPEIEMIDSLETVLDRAVRDQMVSDVPLGAFLSGGIDSSTIVALMQKASSQPVKTFTMGFASEGFDEAPHARAVARHLGTDHTELYVSGQDALDVIPRLPHIYDEPFADSSQIPTVLVSQLARTAVTVSLSGDAGDELFAGYNRYSLTDSLWGKIARAPLPMRSLAASGIRALPPQGWNSLGRRVSSILPQALRRPNLGDLLHKGAGVMTAPSRDALYEHLISHWQANELPLAYSADAAVETPIPQAISGIDRMMLKDMLGYLPGDILTKVDRASMALSLESRVPFLDHRVVEFAWRVPLAFKLRDGQGKWLLRQVLYRHVPRDLIERPKAGFAIPLDQWLRGPLRDWAEHLLDPERLRRQGYFDVAVITRKWNEHLSGRRNWSAQLWIVLMFEAWLDELDG